MVYRKKKTTTQLGKHSPCYRFFLNPYRDVCFTRGILQPLTLQETPEALHDFKEVVTFKRTGGWVRDEKKHSAKSEGIKV